jgi:hypothetical protein
MDINNKFPGSNVNKDWVVIILIFCLIAHYYSAVYPKHQKEALTNGGFEQPWLLTPIRHAQPSIIISTDLSINGCRKILEQNGERYTDEQVVKIKKMLHNLCLLDYELFLKMKASKTC